MRKAALLASSFLALVGGLTAIPASAGILYTSGAPPTNDTNAWGIFNFTGVDTGLWVSDSFSLESASRVNGVDFAVFLTPGDALLSFDWTISTAPSGGQVVAAGKVSSMSSAVMGTAWGTYQVDEESFALPGLRLGAGTYWLTLDGALTVLDGPVWWEQASAAGNGAGGAYAPYGLIPQQEFQILGTRDRGRRPHSGGAGASGDTVGLDAPLPAAHAPEPSGLLLLGTGLAGLALLTRTRHRH